MKRELDEQLCVKYPKIFRDRYGDEMSTAMCWGFECGDGWFHIIDTLCKLIQQNCDETGEQIKAFQVKEKYGGLRFYTDYGNETVWDYIIRAEQLSEYTCEQCGEPGKVRGHGWYYTACDKHTREEDRNGSTVPT